MTEPSRLISTAYGNLDRDALEEVRGSFDTTTLLQSIDELNALIHELTDEDGLRDRLLRLHAMAHTIINGAPLAARVGPDSLPELAEEISSELLEMVEMLEGWVQRIAPLGQLAAGE